MVFTDVGKSFVLELKNSVLHKPKGTFAIVTPSGEIVLAYG